MSYEPRRTYAAAQPDLAATGGAAGASQTQTGRNDVGGDRDTRSPLPDDNCGFGAGPTRFSQTKSYALSQSTCERGSRHNLSQRATGLATTSPLCPCRIPAIIPRTLALYECRLCPYAIAGDHRLFCRLA